MKKIEYKERVNVQGIVYTMIIYSYFNIFKWKRMYKWCTQFKDETIMESSKGFKTYSDTIISINSTLDILSTYYATNNSV